jgi:hypothetical protein
MLRASREAVTALIRQRGRGVGIFRWLPQSAKAPTPNCLDFGWRAAAQKKAVRWRGPAVRGIVPATTSYPGASNAYRRGQIMIDRGISFLRASCAGSNLRLGALFSRPRGLAPRLGGLGAGPSFLARLRQACLGAKGRVHIRVSWMEPKSAQFAFEGARVAKRSPKAVDLPR